MAKYIFEIVKEYVLKHDDLDFSVKGRIMKTVRNDGVDEYRWEISHHYRPTKSAGRYYPSRTTTETFKDAENLLLMYMSGFTAIDVESNNNY